MYAPPPPPARKSTPWALIALILFAGFAAVVGLCAFGAYQGFRMARETPKAREGFGNPVTVKTQADGWARYRLPEVPMEIDLPSKPKKDSMQMDPGSSFFMANWICYAAQSEVNTIYLAGTWYHSEEDSKDLDWAADYADEWVGSVYDAKQIESNAQDAVFGGIRGKQVTGNCEVDGEKMTFAFFYWYKGKAMFSLHTFAWEESRMDGFKEMVRIIQSVKME